MIDLLFKSDVDWYKDKTKQLDEFLIAHGDGVKANRLRMLKRMEIAGKAVAKIGRLMREITNVDSHE